MIFPPMSRSTLQVKARTYFSIHYRGPLNENSGPLCLFRLTSSVGRECCCWKWVQTNSIVTADALAVKTPILTYCDKRSPRPASF